MACTILKGPVASFFSTSLPNHLPSCSWVYPKCRNPMDQFTFGSDLHLDDPLHPFFKNEKFFTGFFWETLTGLNFLCRHTPWWAPVHQWWTTCLHFLNAKYFNDQRKFSVQDARISLLKTSNLVQHECRQQLERKSAKYPLAIIYSRVKFWVGTTENFNQPQLSLLPHGVHHPRRTSCILFLNLSS
jgi:hypothetical protein